MKHAFKCNSHNNRESVIYNNIYFVTRVPTESSIFDAILDVAESDFFQSSGR